MATNTVFDPTHYTIQEISYQNQTLKVRAFENIVYVGKPIDPKFQTMNIYVPDCYFSGGTVNGYTADTAPIFMPNGVGGFMPARPITLAGRTGMPPRAGVASVIGDTPHIPPQEGEGNSILQALINGFVVASSGARGRTLKNEQGEFYGKAPASIVDLKASIRFLKAHIGALAGRADRIIVSGISAGGAMTALLGATGNHTDYEAELNKIGAVAGSDSVFAVSSYCPITNLDNADMAYEWQFGTVADYQTMSVQALDYAVKRELIPGTLTDEQKALSALLKANFTNYLNNLQLTGQNGQALTLDTDGNGSFKDKVIDYLNQSLAVAHKKGVDLSIHSFLKQDDDGNYYLDDYQAYLNYIVRSKVTPAFDGVALDKGENNLFGDTTHNNRHFTEFGKTHSTVQGAETADAQTVKLMNPMYYLDDTGASVAQHWRIRHGAKDGDTSLAIATILATALANRGKSVDFALPWGQTHGGDYDLDELFAWANDIIKQA